MSSCTAEIVSKWPSPPAFGSEIREKEFMLEKGISFLNHGSYGSTPRRVYEETNRHRLEFEQNPDEGMRMNQTPKWQVAVDCAANFLDSNARNLALVRNVTTGIANILFSFPFRAGDEILLTTLTYNSMRHQVDHLTERVRPEVNVRFLDLTLPLGSNERIIDAYTQYLNNHPKVTFAIIDHIMSQPALVNPVSELISLCRARGVTVLIDGAHAPGQIDVSLNTLNPHFYVGTFHKWLYSAKGCAFMYVCDEYRPVIFPIRVSNYYKNEFPGDFITQGLCDDSPYHSLPTAIAFYNWIGEREKITSYCSSLLDRVVPRLCEAWGTSELQMHKTLKPPCLRMLLIPNLPAYGTDNSRLNFDLYTRFGVWSMIVKKDNKFYLRLSANIYCVEEDYDKLKDAILKLMSESHDSPEQVHARQVYEKTPFKN